MDRAAINEIQKSAHIPETLAHLNEVKTHVPVAFVPDGYSMTNIEGEQQYLSRYRMQYHTQSIQDFIEYGGSYVIPGSTCFVDAESMTAKTIFDLGTQEKPLHKEHFASLRLDKTSSFKILLKHKDTRLSQKDAANFIEDWADNLSIIDKSGNNMTSAHAVNALQNLTIESARTLNSQVGDFGSNLSAMEKIEAKNKDSLPAYLQFTCVPYNHLEERTFSLRVSILTGSEKPTISLRIIKLEAIEEDIAEEFKAILVNAFKEYGLTVFMGEA